MAGTMDLHVPSTPSPGRPSRIRTPPAPQHGYADSYEPYSPRKSSRIAQRASNRTPSPQPAPRRRHSPDQPETSLGSPKSTKKKRFIDTMATPAISPQKKRMPPMDPTRRASGTLTAEGTATAAARLGLSPAPAPKPDSVSRRAASAMAGAGSLITPAKTPQKPPNDKVKAKVKSVARNLFHSDDEEMAASPKMRTQTQNPDSFYTTETAETSFQIYTDSRERIPEIDDSAENPFFVGKNSAAPQATTRRSRRVTVKIPGEGEEVSVDEAVRRDDGLLICFRGRKQFRKFNEVDEDSEALDDGEGGLEGAVESPTKRHFTRSSIKPRVLFPMAASDESLSMDEDEEAATDIEDHVLAGLDADKPQTPMDLIDDVPGTPEAPRFGPASPPPTVRTTRFTSKRAADAHPKGKRPASRSPFDKWPRVKGGAQGTGQKRSGEALAGDAPKRTRA